LETQNTNTLRAAAPSSQPAATTRPVAETKTLTGISLSADIPPSVTVGSPIPVAVTLRNGGPYPLTVRVLSPPEYTFGIRVEDTRNRRVKPRRGGFMSAGSVLLEPGEEIVRRMDLHQFLRLDEAGDYSISLVAVLTRPEVEEVWLRGISLRIEPHEGTKRTE
jgi:hypothetical protein